VSDALVALLAANELDARGEADGLRDFELFPHQEQFVASTKPETWIFGGNRTGKSEANAYVGASFLRFGRQDPRPAFFGQGNYILDRAVRVWGISLTYDMGRNILQPKMFRNGAGIDLRSPFIPDSEIASWNITNQTLRLRNGSIAIFKSCDGGRDIFQGADIDLALFDEVPDHNVYDEVTMRVGANRRLLIRGAATILPPPGEPGGVSWMFERKVQPWLRGGGNDASPMLDIFTAGIYDNPLIPEEELRRMEERFTPGSQEYLIRMKGMLLPSIGGAPVYGPYNEDFHTVPALAPVVDGHPRPVVSPMHPLCLSVDFNPIGGSWIVGQYINGVYRVIDEITLERSDIGPMTYAFRERFPTHAAELWIFGDATGRSLGTQTGVSSYHLIAQYLGNYPVPIRYMLPESNPRVQDRVDATNLQLRAPDGRRRVEIAPHCEQLKADLKTTKWKVNGKIDKGAGRQSNAADCLGYWISYESPVRTWSPGTRQAVRTIKSPGMYGALSFPATKYIRPIRQGKRWVSQVR
jgi:phage terminase large subunit-like protein